MIFYLKNRKIIFCVISILVIALITFSLLYGQKFHKKSFVSKEGVEGEYLIYTVPDSEGVLLWLHGDGAYEFSNPDSKEYLDGKDGIKAVAKKKNLTLIVPKTPSKETWWEDGANNSDYLIQLINSIPHHQNLWIGGFSGGAEITTYWLISKLNQLGIKKGGSVLFGGGGSPEEENITDSVKKNKIIKGDFPMIWIVGENDTGDANDKDPFNALEVSLQGQEFYKKQGWKTQRIVLKNFGHVLSKNDIGLYGQYLDKIIPQPDE